jgi:hypothetical protein
LAAAVLSDLVDWLGGASRFHVEESFPHPLLESSSRSSWNPGAELLDRCVVVLIGGSTFS